MMCFRSILLVLALLAIAAPAAAQDPVARNAAVRDAGFYVEAVAQTVDSKQRLAEQIAGLALRAQGDRFGAPKLDAQAKALRDQMDALGADMRSEGRNLIHRGAQDWMADLVGASRRIDGVDLSSAALGLSAITLTPAAAAVEAETRAKAAAQRLAGAARAFRADVSEMLTLRMDVPEDRQDEPFPTGRLVTPEPSAPPAPAGGLMGDILQDLRDGKLTRGGN